MAIDGVILLEKIPRETDFKSMELHGSAELVTGDGWCVAVLDSDPELKDALHSPHIGDAHALLLLGCVNDNKGEVMVASKGGECC